MMEPVEMAKNEGEADELGNVQHPVAEPSPAADPEV